MLGIGDRSYDNFCGHAKAIDGRLAALGATRMLERTECEAYDDEPMDRWADQVTALVCALAEPPPSSGRGGGVSTIARPTRVAEPFTRAKPLLAPAVAQCRADRADVAKRRCASSASTSPSTNVGYAVGDSLGVYATNNRDGGRRLAGRHRAAWRHLRRGRRQ